MFEPWAMKKVNYKVTSDFKESICGKDAIFTRNQPMEK